MEAWKRGINYLPQDKDLKKQLRMVMCGERVGWRAKTFPRKHSNVCRISGVLMLNSAGTQQK